LSSGPSILRLATRGSTLARKQSAWVAERLRELHPSIAIETIIIQTTGDRVTDRPLADIGGKGLFTKEIEQAIIDGEADFAVHSFKDLPVTMPLVDESKLVIAATPLREDPRDVILFSDPSRHALWSGATVGTSSTRRACQVLAVSSGVRIEPLRGNIDTRITKLQSGQYDAILLAMAGLKRAGLFDPTFMTLLDPHTMLPAAGQGALAVQCRVDDARAIEILATLNHQPTEICVRAEREVVRLLRGDCHSPIAALAVQDEPDRLFLRVAVGATGGKPPLLHAESDAKGDDWRGIAGAVVQQLQFQGVNEHLHGNK